MSRFHTDPWVNIVDPGTDKIEVARINYRTLRSVIFRADREHESRVCSLDFLNKMCYLLSFCTVLHQEANIYALWIEVNPTESIIHSRNTVNNTNNASNKKVNLKLIISLSHYMSNTTLESTMQHTETENGEKVYFLIQIFEEHAFDIGPLWTLRVDRFGELGELVWLQRGKSVSGQSMLNLCMQFVDYFGLNACYLMDTAQITLINVPFNTKDGKKYDIKYKHKYKYKYKRNQADNKRKACLRLIHILSSYKPHGGRDANQMGVTWYESHAGFKPVHIKQWPLVPRHVRNNLKLETVTQDIKIYKKAVCYVRNFKLNEIVKLLNEESKPHLQAMIEYYNSYKFDHDTKIEIREERQRKKEQRRQRVNARHAHSNSRGRRSRNRSRSRSRSRERTDDDEKDEEDDDEDLENVKLDSKLPLNTVHDLFRRVQNNAMYAPTKWRRLLGQRHLRILYDILIDPAITAKTKNNGFLKNYTGRKYLESLQEMLNVRVFCRGVHKSDRVDGVLTARKVSKHQIKKMHVECTSLIRSYRLERMEKRKKYETMVNKLIECDTKSLSHDEHKELVDSENEEDEDVDMHVDGVHHAYDDAANEIRLSLNIQNRNSFKHEISINSRNHNEISIHVKSKPTGNVTRRMNRTQKAQETCCNTNSAKKRRSPRLIKLKTGIRSSSRIRSIKSNKI